jgi:N-methylhydantoinase A
LIRIASDIGGTFTDVVLDQDGVLTTAKVLSTPAAPEQGLLGGIADVLALAGVEPGQVDQLIHGTTLATNALIERRGAVTVQIATEGFRDVLEMAHENRFDQYDLSMDRAPPLIPRALRWEVRERVGADGRVLRPLDLDAIDALAERLRGVQARSVAITLMHAYANPDHERALAAGIASRLPDIAISLSSEVSPEIREYERFATTCANAYVQPLMAGYLRALDLELQRRGFRCPLFLVTSGGDLTDLATAIAYPVRLVESGPAGGAVLAASIARASGLNAVLAFDMGGTTAKLCLIDDGKPQTTRSFEVGRVHHNMKGSGFPVRIPAIELVEIGSGGGSLANVDTLGRLLVGPRSAGAVPGPVCYGRGGVSPTVTDADVAMGKIDPALFSGGVALDVLGAEAAVARDIGGPLELSPDLAAFAICEIVDENMAAAARVHAIESGVEVAARTMIAFGGAAPLHAARVARKLGIARVVVPANAGVGSAVGFLAAGLAFEQARSLYMPLAAFDAARANAVLDDMEASARRLIEVEGAALSVIRSAYMRYVGQGHEISVGLPEGVLDTSAREGLGAAFEQRYVALFGSAIPSMAIEILTWIVRVERLEDRAPPSRVEHRPAAPTSPRSRPVFDPTSAARLDYRVVGRDALIPGDRIVGPCLVTESQTTTVVPSDFDLAVGDDRELLLTAKPRRNEGAP